MLRRKVQGLLLALRPSGPGFPSTTGGKEQGLGRRVCVCGVFLYLAHTTLWQMRVGPDLPYSRSQGWFTNIVLKDNFYYFFCL